ncbi:hypothetical protein RI103_34030 [Paraburkholderia sp. FT54]|uniref:hypothetical protein n=1 Tax=Paraburkholderia sp. FT54 TaxID=3074437 RepID=UPI0028777BE2|nr:hypothetical protein [Paraburkholderia sp. FT54]WNC94919.1 hypothetical protein RI103_34030 [Paraburkholderia sp. FT54]
MALVLLVDDDVSLLRALKTLVKSERMTSDTVLAPVISGPASLPTAVLPGFQYEADRFPVVKSNKVA